MQHQWATRWKVFAPTATEKMTPTKQVSTFPQLVIVSLSSINAFLRLLLCQRQSRCVSQVVRKKWRSCLSLQSSWTSAGNRTFYPGYTDIFGCSLVGTSFINRNSSELPGAGSATSSAVDLWHVLQLLGRDLDGLTWAKQPGKNRSVFPPTS